MAEFSITLRFDGEDFDVAVLASLVKGLERARIHPPPPGPLVAAATLTALGEITVSFAPAMPGSLHVVYRTSAASPADADFALIGTVPSGLEAYVDGGLADGVSYTYRVYAGIPGRLSATFAQTAAVSSYTQIPAPFPFTANNGINGVDLAWTQGPAADLITGFEIQRKLDSAGAGAWATILLPAAADRDATDTDPLTPSTAYDYRIRGLTAVLGPSDWSDNQVVTTPPAAAPSPPTNPSATALTSSSIQVSYTLSPTSGATYVVERSANGTTGWTVAATPAAGVSSAVVGSLNQSTTYYFRVKANTIAGGDSSYTAVVNATTPASDTRRVPVFPDDYTYVGGFRVPNPTGSESKYGRGLTFANRSGTKTLISTDFTGGGGTVFGVYEFSIPTPGTLPAGSYNTALLPSATILKNYARSPFKIFTGSDGATPAAGSTTFTSASATFNSLMVGGNIYVTTGTNFTSNKSYQILTVVDAHTVTLAASPTPSGAGSAANFTIDMFPANYLTGDHNIYFHQATGKLLWSWHTGYDNTWGFGSSSLDYASGTGACLQYNLSLTNQGGKSWGHGFVLAPQAYADAYLGGSRFVLCGGAGNTSRTATGDVSYGASMTSVPDFLSDPSGTTYAGTPLFGYWPDSTGPTGTNGRQNRPAATINNGPYSPYNQGTWGLDKFGYLETCQGYVWVDSPNYSGVVAWGVLCPSMVVYLSGTVTPDYTTHWAGGFDPDDFTPASGTPRYAVQPDWCDEINLRTTDYTDFNSGHVAGTAKAITSVTSTAGALHSNHTGAIVTCPGHGQSGTTRILGAAAETKYNSLWNLTVIDANSFYIWNNSQNSAPLYAWAGTTDTTPGMVCAKLAPVTENIMGVCEDPDTHRVYILYRNVIGTPDAGGAVVEVWDLNNPG